MVLVSTSCFDEIILAEIVISGSQVVTKFDQILSYFNRFDCFVFSFLFMVCFWENHKLVETSFFDE